MNYEYAEANFKIDPTSKYGIVSTNPEIVLSSRGTSNGIQFKLNGKTFGIRPIAWMLYNKKDVPDNKRVLPKNGNPKDITESNLVLVQKTARLSNVGITSIKSWTRDKRNAKKEVKETEYTLCPTTFNYVYRYLEPFSELEYFRLGNDLYVHPTETNEYIKIQKTHLSGDIDEEDRRYLILNSRCAPVDIIKKKFSRIGKTVRLIRDKDLLAKYAE